MQFLSQRKRSVFSRCVAQRCIMPCTYKSLSFGERLSGTLLALIRQRVQIRVCFNVPHQHLLIQPLYSSQFKQYYTQKFVSCSKTDKLLSLTRLRSLVPSHSVPGYVQSTDRRPTVNAVRRWIAAIYSPVIKANGSVPVTATSI